MKENPSCSSVAEFLLATSPGRQWLQIVLFSSSHVPKLLENMRARSPLKTSVLLEVFKRPHADLPESSHLSYFVTRCRHKPEGSHCSVALERPLQPKYKVSQRHFKQHHILSERKTFLSSCSFLPPCKGSCVSMCICCPLLSLPSSRVRFS